MSNHQTEQFNEHQEEIREEKLHNSHRIHPCDNGYQCIDCKEMANKLSSVCAAKEKGDCDCEYIKSNR